MNIRQYSSFEIKMTSIGLVTFMVFLSACGGGGSDSGQDGKEDVVVGAIEPPLPFFEKPFDSDFPVANLFDHDLPFQFVDINGYAVDHEGVLRNIGEPGAGIDGHEGHDWLMPTGTTLKAVADGEVTTAGENTFSCPALPGSPMVTQKDVQIRHIASNGDYYDSSYSHLDTIAVSVGDIVNAGQILGTSGNTGCSTAPHLHFQVFWWSTAQKKWFTVDPYGWTGISADPWAQYPDGAVSYPLWKAGQAPTLFTP